MSHEKRARGSYLSERAGKAESHVDSVGQLLPEGRSLARQVPRESVPEQSFKANMILVMTIELCLQVPGYLSLFFERSPSVGQ